ncbi:hypothetical protein SAMN04487770_13644 [Butyrivibrio sp. ob235]|nr:hypothetical protein SAMN04487770_13644 [Butyrivibrio sp. ob235]
MPRKSNSLSEVYSYLMVITFCNDRINLGVFSDYIYVNRLFVVVVKNVNRDILCLGDMILITKSERINNE